MVQRVTYLTVDGPQILRLLSEHLKLDDAAQVDASAIIGDKKWSLSELAVRLEVEDDYNPDGRVDLFTGNA